jgi:hypothetical protein
MKERDALDQNYKTLFNNLMRYEDINIEYYADSDPMKRVTTHAEVGDFKEKIDSTYKVWKNPYRDAYIWLKGELLDIKGMADALAGRDAVIKKQSDTAQKKSHNETEVEKLKMGKTSIKNFFKGKEGKEKDIQKKLESIEMAKLDLVEYQQLINFLTVYLGEVSI